MSSSYEYFGSPPKPPVFRVVLLHTEAIVQRIFHRSVPIFNKNFIRHELWNVSNFEAKYLGGREVLMTLHILCPVNFLLKIGTLLSKKNRFCFINILTTVPHCRPKRPYVRFDEILLFLSNLWLPAFLEHRESGK